MARVPSWIAMEEFENADIVNPETAEVPSETVEAKLVEVDGLDRQIENLIDDGQELADDTDNVEQLAETIEATEDDGGIDETTAEVAEIATEAFCAKWCIRRQSIAKENFADRTTRRQATRFAVESLMDTAKGLWQRFLDMIQGLIDRAKEMWYNFTNAGSRLKKRVDKLRAAVDKYFKENKSNVVSDKPLEGSWIKNLLINGDVAVDKVIEFAKGSGLTEKVSATTSTALVVAGDVVIEPLSADTRSRLEKAQDKLKDGYKSFMNLFASSDKNIGIPEGGTNGMSCTLPGDLVVTYYEKEGVSYVMRGSRAAPKDLKMPAQGRGKINEALDALGTLAKTMEETIKGFRKHDEAMKTLKGKISEAVKNYGKAEGEEAKKAAKLALQIARQAVLNSETEKACLNQGRSNAAQGLTAMVEKSLAAHSKRNDK